MTLLFSAALVTTVPALASPPGGPQRARAEMGVQRAARPTVRERIKNTWNRLRPGKRDAVRPDQGAAHQAPPAARSSRQVGPRGAAMPAQAAPPPQHFEEHFEPEAPDWDQPEVQHAMMGQQGAQHAAPPIADPRAIAFRSRPGRGVRSEVKERMTLVKELVNNGQLETAADFIPHARGTELSGAERRGFNKLAGKINKEARKLARNESKSGNIGSARPRGWQPAPGELADYQPGTALDGLRALDNLKGKELGGGLISRFQTARATRKAEKSITGWTKRSFWQRRNFQTTASAVGALIERGASERKVGKAVRNAYGEFMKLASRDSRTGDVDTALASLSFMEMLAESPEIPDGVREKIQRQLQKDDKKIRKTRLKAYEVGIQYSINMAARQRNTKDHGSAEALLSRAFYMTRKYKAVKAAGGRDVPPEELYDRDGNPTPITIGEVKGVLKGRDLYTKHVLKTLMKPYGAKAASQGLQQALSEAAGPRLQAQLGEIEGAMQELEAEADHAHGQLMKQGHSQESAEKLLEKQYMPRFQELMSAHEQIASQFQQ